MLWDALIDFEGWIKGLFADFINGLLSSIAGFLQNINVVDLLTQPIETLFGSSAASDIYQFATAIENGVIEPVGGGILALCLLVELIKISAKMDGQQTLPAVREILALVVFFAVFNWLIANAAEICAMIFKVTTNISVAIAQSASADIAVNFAFAEPADLGDVGWADFLVALLIGLIMWIVALLCYVASLVVVYARAIQIYVMVAFSPIPLALLGFEETRSFGVGFLRNFAAIAMAGVIMMFLLMAFPMLLSSVIQGQSFTWAGDFSQWVMMLTLLAVMVLFLLAMVKSGSWARDLLGA